MKFSTIFASALLGLTASGLTIPASSQGLQKRQTASAYEIVSTLYTNVQQYTGVINSTAASLTSTSTAAENATAAIVYQEAVSNITSLVTAATTQVNALGVSASVSVKRQDDTTADALAGLVENVLLDVSGALNNIIGTLGLTSLLSGLTPLVSSLSGLLLSLETVVNNLLALVQQLVDGLLTGLSVGLAGLTL